MHVHDHDVHVEVREVVDVRQILLEDVLECDGSQQRGGCEAQTVPEIVLVLGSRKNTATLQVPVLNNCFNWGQVEINASHLSLPSPQGLLTPHNTGPGQETQKSYCQHHCDQSGPVTGPLSSCKNHALKHHGHCHVVNSQLAISLRGSRLEEVDQTLCATVGRRPLPSFEAQAEVGEIDDCASLGNVGKVLVLIQKHVPERHSRIWSCLGNT
eukprot:2866858-Rhodomonas_salina.2